MHSTLNCLIIRNRVTIKFSRNICQTGKFYSLGINRKKFDFHSRRLQHCAHTFKSFITAPVTHYCTLSFTILTLSIALAFDCL